MSKFVFICSLLLFMIQATYCIPAFPGAEGFGAVATGGRGGVVVYVTNLNESGPGSFNAALQMNVPRYILFKVSGVVSPGTRWGTMTQLRAGNVTIAGQTSPGGIITRGFLSYNNVQEGNPSRDNVIIRHIRTRPEGIGLDDAMRIMECKNAIIDHCSLGHAGDECLQITNDSNYTIQNCIFTETLGEHYDRGGILIKYSSDTFPNNNISVHHNIWNRIGGRMPLVSCDDVTTCTRCLSGVMYLEVSSNLMWDPGTTILFSNQFLDGSRMGFHYNLNCIGNYYYSRPAPKYPYGMFSTFNEVDNQLYLSNNKFNIYPNYSDYQLIYCCNHFYDDNPNNKPPKGHILTERHPFPSITYQDPTTLPDYMVNNAGAFPRDSMDRRLMKYVKNRVIDTTPLNIPGENGIEDAFIFDWKTAPIPPADNDSDGMPDEWEKLVGLNPKVQDHNGTELSIKFTGIAGYTNLECYLNALSDSLVKGVPFPGFKANIKQGKRDLFKNSPSTKNQSFYNIRGQKLFLKKDAPMPQILKNNYVANSLVLTRVDETNSRANIHVFIK